MRIDRLALRDFMGYTEADLDLSDGGPFVVVGPNGAGKSTLLDAVTWALYDRVTRNIASADGLIRDGADSMAVSVEFTTAAGSHVTVYREKQRARTGALTLTVDGEAKTSHTQAETRALIADLIGLSYEALMVGPVMAQETSGAFMAARPGERKALLARLFDLGQYERYHAEAKTRATDAKAKVQAATMVRDNARDIVARGPAAHAALAAAQRDLATAEEARSLASERIKAAEAVVGAQGRRTEVMRRRDDVATRLANTIARIGQIQADLKAPLEVEPASPTESAIQEAAATVNVATEAAAHLRDLQTQLVNQTALVKRMQSSRAMVADVPCGAVGPYAACQFLQAVPDEAEVESAVAKETGLTAVIERFSAPDPAAADRAWRFLIDSRQRANEVRARNAAVTEARATFVKTLDHLADEQAALRSEVDGFEAELATLPLADATLAAELEGARSTYQQAERLIETADAARRRALSDVAAVEAGQAAEVEWSATLADWQGKQATYERLAEAFHRDGIPSRILAAGIPRIEEEANRVLAGLPGDMTITLRTTRENQSGGLTDTLDVLVSVDGWDREYGLLSVGQRFRVDLALRLGLARVVAHRTGASVETLWLDEPLAALDATSREAVIETLAALSLDYHPIIVVSHHPDFNDRFPSRIEVSQEDTVSTARLM